MDWYLKEHLEYDWAKLYHQVPAIPKSLEKQVMLSRKRAHIPKAQVLEASSKEQSHLPRPASGCPCCNAALVLLHLASPLVNHKGQKLPGHQAEWFLLVLIHYTDWTNVIGSLAKIPRRVSCKERREKLPVWETESWNPWGKVTSTPLGRSSAEHHYSHLTDDVFLLNYGMNQATICYIFQNCRHDSKSYLHTVVPLAQGNP